MPSTRAVTLALSCLVLALATGLTGLSSAKEPQAPATPAEIVRYHDSGEWARDTTRTIQRAKTFVRGWLARHRGNRRGNPAIVLDIDDTSLSLYDCAKARNFQASVVCSVTEATLPVIRQTKSLYKLARRRGVAVFFITGRPEGLRPITVSQLEAGGYRGYRALYLRPADDHAASLVPYKSSTREAITKSGYRILANVGDQQSDLNGGYARRAYKLPNPMYFTP